MTDGVWPSAMCNKLEAQVVIFSMKTEVKHVPVFICKMLKSMKAYFMHIPISVSEEQSSIKFELPNHMFLYFTPYYPLTPYSELNYMYL